MNEKNNIKQRKLFNLSIEAQQYLFIGFLLGVLFPFISWTLDIIHRDIPLTISGILIMHKSNPLHFIIDLAPLILFLVALVLAKRIDKERNAFKNDIQKRKEYVNKILAFTDEISKGNYEVKLDVNKDYLASKLIEMRDGLKASHLKESKQNWKIKGREIISSTLTKYNVLEDLSYYVLLDIIKYTKLIQGAFYLYDEEKKIIRNIASYAYGRKKYFQQEIEVGIGLVGQVAFEKQYIYRKEIPEDYITITSGILGDKKPGAILLVPLISDGKLRGIIELAAIENEISKDVIEFVKGLGELIGQTIFNITINEKTVKLLKESRAMTAELQENEEELRQNAEEMQATQEELEKSNIDLEIQVREVENAQTKLNALLENASEVISIVDIDGVIQYESPASYNILGVNSQKRIGHNLFNQLGKNKKIIEKVFNKVKQVSSKIEKIEFEYNKPNGKLIWLELTAINLIKNPAIAGIIFNTRDITQRKIAEEEQRKRGQMQSLSENSSDIIIRIDLQANFFYVNPTFTKYTGILVEEALNKSIDKIQLPEGMTNFFIKTLEETKINPQKKIGEFTIRIEEENRIMEIASIPEFDNNKKIESVLFVAHDITEQKQIELEIKDKNKKINDSINYAKRIQNAILPDENFIKKYFDDSFMFYKPKDVVSGDFPWLFEKEDIVYIAAVDCTGHGVPGALLSFIGYFILQNIVDHDRELTASQVCDELHYGVRKMLKQDQEGANARDGMDIALCKYNKKTKVLEYSGAHRPLYLLRNKEIEIFKGDRKAIGGIPHKKKVEKDFTNYVIDIQKGDKIFFFSDGYPDQVGEETKKKYQAKRMRELILQYHNLKMIEYEEQFSKDFYTFKGEHKQIDDILLIGIAF